MKLTTTILALITATAFAQGPLAPPGAPAPTMKTLDEIHTKVADSGEKRTPISSIPFTITQPGSYYLTGNLSTALAVDGISIDAKNVTIDLNGFRMTGNGAGLKAINITNANVTTETLVVKNGTITGWQTAIDGNATSIIAGSIEDVHIRDGLGIILQFAKGISVQRCVLDNIAGVGGINMGDDCTISECRTRSSMGLSVSIILGFRSLISDVSLNGPNVGILVGPSSVVKNCSVTGGGGTAIGPGTSSILSGCSVSGSFYTGILMSDYGLVENCSVTLSGTPFSGVEVGVGSRVTNSVIRTSNVALVSVGIILNTNSVVENVTVAGFDCGISASAKCILRQCKVQDASSENIFASDDSKITDCQIENSPIGIKVGARCVISKNTIKGNTSGISAGTGIQVINGSSVVIEANEIIACATGISVSTTSNMVFRNTLRSNILPLSIIGGNEVGPTGAPSTATSPFANLVY